MNLRPEGNRRRPYSLFGYEIYDNTRCAIGSVVSVTIGAFFFIDSCTQAKTPTELAVKCACSLGIFASAMALFLRAEDRAVKAARAGQRVFNAFRNTYYQNDVGQEPNADFRPQEMKKN